MRSVTRKTLNADGAEAACEKASSVDRAPPENCGAFLRVEVVPLRGVAAPAMAVAGFGSNLGDLPLVPTVGPLPAAPAEATGLRDAAIDLLQRLQTAIRAEKNPEATASERAGAWMDVERFALASGNDDVRMRAWRRKAEWRAVAEAEARRRVQVEKVCALYKANRAKLNQLLALDDAVVSAQQKQAYRAELLAAYSAWRAPLSEECPGPAQP
jgi:hypothetical protein